MKYCVVQALKLEWLVEEVNRNIQEGWKPVGGIAVHHNTHYYQAMVKESV